MRDVVLYAAQFERWHRGAGETLRLMGGEVVASAADASGLSELIAIPGSVDAQALRAALTEAGASLDESGRGRRPCRTFPREMSAKLR